MTIRKSDARPRDEESDLRRRANGDGQGDIDLVLEDRASAKSAKSALGFAVANWD